MPIRCRLSRYLARPLLSLTVVVVLFPAPAHSQVLSVTNDLEVWLRGEDAIDAGGGAVATWPDASGNANNATQGGAAKRPTIVAAAIGGRDAVRFDGVDDRLDFVTNVFGAAGYPLSIFVVMQTVSSNAHLVGMGSSSAGFLSSYGSGLAVIGDELALKANSAAVGTLLNQSETLSDGQPRILFGSGRAYQHSTWVNCELAGTSSATANPYPYSKATLGASDGSNSNSTRDPFDGDIAEVLVYSRMLTPAERISVEQYLAARYGASLCTPSPAEVTLNEGLRLFYGLNESGPTLRVDRISSLHLTPFPTTGSEIDVVPGVVGLANEIDGPAGAHLFRSSAPELDLDDGSFTFAGWVRLNDLTNNQSVVGKWNLNASAERETHLFFDAATSQYTFDVSGTGFEGGGDSARVAHPVAATTGTWSLLEAWYDAPAGTLSIRKSTSSTRGATESVAWSGGVWFGPADLDLGAHNTSGAGYIDGTLDALGLWGRVLTEDESLALWNSGSGLELSGQPGEPIVSTARIFPALGSLCGVGYDPITEKPWVIPCFGGLVQELSETGALLGTVSRPGESANDVDLEFAPEGLDLGGTAASPGDLLFLNGETAEAEIYGVDVAGAGSVFATLFTDFGVSHVVGGAYHPDRDTFFLIQDEVPGGAPANLVAEVDSTTGLVLNDFEIASYFNVNYGDLDVCGENGNLFIVSSDEDSIVEFTPDGAFVAYHGLPSYVTDLSGIALIDGTKEAWVSTSTGHAWRLDSVPCPVPEPGAAIGLLAGIVELALLQRRRARRRR